MARLAGMYLLAIFLGTLCGGPAFAAEFKALGYRSLAFVTLTAEDLVGKVQVSEEELRDEYELRRQEFTTPERRTIKQLLAKDEEAIRPAVEQAATGVDFEMIAAENPAAALVDLGDVEHGELPASLEAVAFGLAEGEVSKPVRSAVGWHLFRVEDIQPEGVVPFEEVRDELRRRLVDRRAPTELPWLDSPYQKEEGPEESYLAQIDLRAGLVQITVPADPISTSELQACLHGYAAGCFLEVAERTAQAIGAQHARAMSLADVARAQAETGRIGSSRLNFNKAIEVARNTNCNAPEMAARPCYPGQESTLTLVGIAKLQAAAGLASDARLTLAEAIQFTDRIGPPIGPLVSPNLLAWIAMAYAEIGDREKAIETLNMIDDVRNADMARVGIVRVLAEHGEISDAMPLTDAIADDAQKEEALAQVMKAMVKDRNFEAALGVMDKMHDKTWALVEIGVALDDEMLVDRAIREDRSPWKFLWLSDSYARYNDIDAARRAANAAFELAMREAASPDISQRRGALGL